MPLTRNVQDLILKPGCKYKVRMEGTSEYTLVTFQLVTDTGYNFVDEKGEKFLKKSLYDSKYLNKPGFIKVYASNKLVVRPEDFVPKQW